MTRGAIAATLAALSLSGCATVEPTATDATQPPASATAATATTTSPASPTPSPLPVSATPTPAAQPPFTYVVPAGWLVAESDAYQVQLALPESTDSASQIRLAADPASEDIAGARRTTVAHHLAYVLSDGVAADGSTYRRDVLITTSHGYDELTCTGYGAYDRATLLAGCDSFTQSLDING